MKKLQLTLPALLGVLAWLPTSTHAQVSTTSGFPIGEKSRIHTNLEVGVGYDSNRERFESGQEELTGQLDDWRAIIRPGLEIKVPGSSFSLGLRSQLTITQFFGTRNISSDTSYGGNIGLQLQFGSDDSIISFKIEDELVRTPVLFDESGTVASDERRFRQWFNDGSARITLRPGGRALELDFGYRNRLALYDTDDNSLPKGQQHGGIFEARWRFLPKTVLLFHGDISTFLVTDDRQTGDLRTSEGLPVHVYVGAVGQVTARLQAELTVGYGDTLSDESSRGTRGPIATANLSYQIRESMVIQAGYRRSIEPVVALSSYSSDAGFMRYSSLFFGRLTLQLLGQYELRTFAAIPGIPGLDDGSQAGVITGDARVEYWFFSWLRASVNYRLLMQLAEDEAQVVNRELGLPGLQEFTRQQVFFNVGFRY